MRSLGHLEVSAVGWAVCPQWCGRCDGSPGNVSGASIYRKGLFRFRINPDLKRVEDVRTYMELGDVKDGDFSLFKINGRVVFSNGEMFYTYEDMNDSIIPYESMNEQLGI